MAHKPIELQLRDVTAGYSGAAVVHNLSVQIRQGQRVGLIGRNGAGKTTTLACAMGLAQLQRGAWATCRKAVTSSVH